MSTTPCPICASPNTHLAFAYSEPPSGENRFDWLKDYYRAFHACQACHHYFAVHSLDLSQLYTGAYTESVYDGERMRRSFEKIQALPPEKSDNQARVAFVKDKVTAVLGSRVPSLLDVGSGLGVFPARIRELGWDVTALDPDPRATEHIRAMAGVATLTGDFLQLEPSPEQCFDLLSFNKVIEHVPDPVAMLARAARWLNAGGLVYVELPDGEDAAAEGPGREEFFLEHYHAFSAASYALLIQQAGFSLLTFERLREPSGKYTLRGLCRKA